MTEWADYAIVGGGVAAGYAAQSIRSKDKSGRILLISREAHAPYDRTPLSKDYLRGEKTLDELFIKKSDYYIKRRIEVLESHNVNEVDAKSRYITLDDGVKIGFGRLLMATGAEPRRLVLPGSGLDGVCYLKTIEDSNVIRDKLVEVKDAVVIGGGFIGCELASAFIAKGIKTTIIEMGKFLLNTSVDEETGLWLGNYYKHLGANVLVNTTVSEILGKDGRAIGVRTTDGKSIPTDLVCVGVGIALNTDLAERAGVEVDRGILVNAYLETSIPRIYAAGDATRFFSPIFQRYLHVEHYDVATKQGRLAGKNMAGEKLPFDEIPYFFSDQLGLEINAFGDLSGRKKVVKGGPLDEEKGFVEYYFDDARLSAVLAVNKEWEEIEEARDLVLLRKKYDDVLPILTH